MTNCLSLVNFLAPIHWICNIQGTFFRGKNPFILCELALHFYHKNSFPAFHLAATCATTGLSPPSLSWLLQQRSSPTIRTTFHIANAHHYCSFKHHYEKKELLICITPRYVQASGAAKNSLAQPIGAIGVVCARKLFVQICHHHYYNCQWPQETPIPSLPADCNQIKTHRHQHYHLNGISMDFLPHFCLWIVIISIHNHQFWPLLSSLGTTPSTEPLFKQNKC